MKLKYKTIEFKRIKKKRIHDQFVCFSCKERNFLKEIGLIIWNEFDGKYGYMTTFVHTYTEEQWNEIGKFLKQLNK